MTWKTLGALAGAVALALTAGSARRAAEAQGRLHLCRPGRRPRLELPARRQGRKAIEKAFGDKVETTFVESVPEADSERAIEQLARTGHGLIFTTSFGFMEPTLKVAKKYPNVKFEHATGFKRAPNLATYAAKFHEGRYIIGQIAGKMSKTGTIGYVGAFPIPEVVAGINSYFLGAQSVNPNIKIKVVWANSWYDPAKEATPPRRCSTRASTCSPSTPTARRRSRPPKPAASFGFGQASDMERFAPKAQLTAIVDNWSDYYVARTKAALDGTWKSEDTWGGLNDDMVVMSPYKNMPDDVKKMAEETEAAIKSGKLNPFKCPVVKQDGSAGRVQGQRRAVRRAGPRHELLREGHRRQAAAIDQRARHRARGGSRPTGCLFRRGAVIDVVSKQSAVVGHDEDDRLSRHPHRGRRAVRLPARRRARGAGRRRGHRADQPAGRGLPALHADAGLASAGPCLLRVEPFGPSSRSRRSELAYGSQVLWPDHCVQGTRGAEIARELDVPHAATDHPQGHQPAVDSYSGFVEADRKTATGLAGYLRERGFRRVFCAGLATDFCVAWTALDAKEAGFETYRHRGCLPGHRLGGVPRARLRGLRPRRRPIDPKRRNRDRLTPPRQVGLRAAIARPAQAHNRSGLRPPCRAGRTRPRARSSR